MRLPRGSEHMFQRDAPLVTWKIDRVFKAYQGLINSYVPSFLASFSQI